LASTYDFQPIATVWAAIKNIKGDAVLDGVAINEIPTHWFYIRYRDDVTNDNWFLFRNERYKIMQVQNLMEDNVYLQVKCLKTGEALKGASEI
jgi:SPP1 family predicted phage head-tail adaptor